MPHVSSRLVARVYKMSTKVTCKRNGGSYLIGNSLSNEVRNTWCALQRGEFREESTTWTWGLIKKICPR